MKYLYISLLVFFITSVMADNSCRSFPPRLYGCGENFSCSYKPTADSPELKREIIPGKVCMHKEELTGGHKLECNWNSIMDRAHVRWFYADLIDKGEIDPGNSYTIGGDKGSNPIHLAVAQGKCKLTKDGKELTYSVQKLNNLMLASATSEAKDREKIANKLKNEISNQKASSKDNKRLTKFIKKMLDKEGKLKSLEVKSFEFTSDAMERVFDASFFAVHAAINGQRSSIVVMVRGKAGINMIQKPRGEDTIIPKYIKSSFILNSKSSAKTLLKALKHVYRRQDSSDNPAEGYTRTVKKEGAVWTIYDAHKERLNSGLIVKTDGKGSVISISKYFMDPVKQVLKVK